LPEAVAAYAESRDHPFEAFEANRDEGLIKTSMQTVHSK
jgi:hypothetical protein